MCDKTYLVHLLVWQKNALRILNLKLIIEVESRTNLGYIPSPLMSLNSFDTLSYSKSIYKTYKKLKVMFEH